MLYASAAALPLLAVLLLGACTPRVTQQAYSRCGLVPADSAPLGEVVARTSPIAGELHVKAHLREGVTQPYMVTLVPIDSGRPARSVTTDTVATFRDLPPGVYRLRLQTLTYSPRSVQLKLSRDSGQDVDIPMRYGGVSFCEDGIRLVRRAWWRLW
jgi:hypothetical protein